MDHATGGPRAGRQRLARRVLDRTKARGGDVLELRQRLLPLESDWIQRLNRSSGGALGDRWPTPHVRHGLLVVAALSALPEDDIEHLPEAAREEAAGGLRGPIRAALAAEFRPLLARSDWEVANERYLRRLTELRGEILAQYGAGRNAASDVIIRAHLARAVRGTVPLVVGMAQFYGYGAMVAQEPDVLALMRRAYHLKLSWDEHPEGRADVEAEMLDLARSEVGDDPPDYLDLDL